MGPQVAPYGTWVSPITSDAIIENVRPSFPLVVSSTPIEMNLRPPLSIISSSTQSLQLCIILRSDRQKVDGM